MNNLNHIDIGQKYKRLVQYLWDPEPKNEDPDAPLWCLGQEYRTPRPANPSPSVQGSADGDSIFAWVSERSADRSSLSSRESGVLCEGSGSPGSASKASVGDWPLAFLDDFESKIWLTYRSSFPAIPKSNTGCDTTAPKPLSARLGIPLGSAEGFTTDTGWGCMIRSGQSLLANALSILTLGREWRRGTKLEEETRLLSLFADDPRAPFSIHRFVEHGASSCGKHPGEWFGPSATARCIEALSIECQHAGLNVYVANDGPEVYEDRFRRIASDRQGKINPTLILLGVRLGIDQVTPVYWPSLRSAVQSPQSVGIAGGRPSSSHYFVGVQGEYFFYLDPHHTRPALPYEAWSSTLGTEELSSYHTRRLRRLHVREMDPSMLIGFLIKNEDDWTDWKCRIRQGEGKAFIHIFDHETSVFGRGPEREEAVDEVEILDDDEDT